MIKLYVGAHGGCYDDSREYEISDELAEFLRFKAWEGCKDEMDEEDKVCNRFFLEFSDADVEDMISDKEVPESIAKELIAIDDDASSVVYELAIGSYIDEYPPEEWDVDGWLKEDMKAGWFKPSQNFEEFIKDKGWDPSDEDYDEEEAQDAYKYFLYDEYEDWVDTLSPCERAERFGLDDTLAIDDVEHGYTFDLIDKAAES